MQQLNTKTQNQPPPFRSRPDEPRIHRFSTAEYYQMEEIGLFFGKRVELIGGEIIEMAAMNVAHATAVTLADKLLQKIFAENFVVRVQTPLNFSDGEEPEPDVAIVVGEARDYSKSHPNTAILIIEIAETSVIYDQTTKASLYAKNGIQDYWIVNLKNRRLEIYRQPIQDSTARFGFSYSITQILIENNFISPLAKPEAEIAVADLLP